MRAGTCSKQEAVVRLEVAVYDILRMQVPDSQSYLGYIEPSMFLQESSSMPQASLKFTTSTESHHEVDLELSLEDKVHVDEENMLDFHQDLLLLDCHPL